MTEQHPAVSGKFFNAALSMGLTGVCALILASAITGEGVFMAAGLFGVGYLLIGGGVVYFGVHGFAVVMFHQAKLGEAEEQE